MINWGLLILFISISLKEFKILKEVVIATKKNVIEIILVLMGVTVISFITYVYAKIWIHYLLAIVCTTLYVVGYLKTGITLNGFASMYRGAQFVPWNKVQEVHINIGKNIKVSYSENGFSNNLYFENKDYDEIIKFLEAKLPNKLVTVDHNL